MPPKKYLDYLQPNHVESSGKEKYLAEPKQRRLINLWNEFLSEVIYYSPCSDEVKCEGLKAVPTLNTIKAFLGWLAEEKPGRSGGQRCVNTILKEWDRLHHILKLNTNSAFPKLDVEDMKKHIGQLCKDGSLAPKSADKGLANAAVVLDLLHFLWVCDEHVFNHPRERLQLAFCISIFGALGVRPGELSESINHRGSNDGLKYKDCELSVLRTGELQLLYNRRLRKGYRLRPGEAHRLVLTEVPQDRSRCPLTLFLALAIADGALSLDDIRDLRVLRGANSKRLVFQEQMLEVPVLRATVKHDRTSENTILKYSTLDYQLTELGARAGYKESLTAYCFRRAVGAALDKNVTQAERMQVMGHDRSETFRAYQSTVVGVHSQAIMFGETQDMARIDFVRSMSYGRDGQAPKRSTASLKKSGVRAPRVSRTADETLKKRAARRMQLRNERSQHFQGQRKQDDSDSSSCDEDFEFVEEGGLKRVRPKPSPWISILFRYDTNRAEVVRNFYPDEDSEPLSLTQALEPLVKIADPKPWRLSYPIPGIDGLVDKCPWCPMLAKERTPISFNNHLLGCCKRNRIKICNEDVQHTCLLKSIPISNPQAPTSACASLITKGSETSETSTKLPVNRPTFYTADSFGKLRSSVCRWNNCNFSFVDEPLIDVATHMSIHAHRSKRRCGWFDCVTTVADPLELKDHLAKAHGVPCKETLEDKAFFCHQCAWWATSEYAWEKHCDQHLKNLEDPFCGNLVKKGAAIFAALCPFCLGDCGKPSQRYRQFPAGNIRGHVLAHFWKQFGWAPGLESGSKGIDNQADTPPDAAATESYEEEMPLIPCPHPLCKGKGSSYRPPELLAHFGEHHSLLFAAESEKKPTSNAIAGAEKLVKETSESSEDAIEESGYGTETAGATSPGTIKRKFDCISEATSHSNKQMKKD